MNPTGDGFRSGYVAIIGPPNAGKSTLLNRILGQKLSITSKKPQTTRNRILGIAHRPTAQILFIDTPGIHASEQMLNQRIVESAIDALADADLVLLVVDLALPDDSAESLILKRLGSIGRPVLLAMNKSDRVKAHQALDAAKRWSGLFSFVDIIPISATQGTGVDDLLELLAKRLPIGPAFYPDDQLTDLPTRFLAAEIIREKIVRLTGQEMPYAAAVTVDSFIPGAGKQKTRIGATIHVERDSQKGILIGRGATRLKRIGQEARGSIEALIDAPVFLELFVRVQKNWSRDARALRRFGY